MNHTIEMIGWWRTPDNGYGRKVAVFWGLSQSHRTVENRCESGSGGDGGIRTHDRVTPIHTFQACAFDHSATSPHPIREGTPLAAPLRFRKAHCFAITKRMKRYLTLFTSAAIFAVLPLSAQEQAKKEFPAPTEIVAAAKADEWVAIAPSDLLVMDLAPDAKGKARRAVIQLMPAPFSQGWVGNIRKLAAAHWWDGTSINRVQDNYVVQWGDATEKKALPDGLAVVPESEYVSGGTGFAGWVAARAMNQYAPHQQDSYGRSQPLWGWPIGNDGQNHWPIHCYGMVGVGRNLSPDTGTGAELYTVIGHAPRHLDRNIALVGRVIEGMEHLSSLPRGTGALGFYETEGERVPIISVRLASEMASDKPLPAFEYLSTESDSFAKYADARANRRDPFFNVPAGGADICNIPVPVRRKTK
jgi:cyclophilin family peptidyl-prolyl cis-trans isomerase